MISVIIATLNRANAINNVSLPSLLRQDNNNFEVIVWDASDNDETEKICHNYSSLFRNNGSPLRYEKAPRRGSASQRNDAVDKANGDIVFFIDDDCEISIDAISSLHNYFNSFPWLNGAGIPMLNKTTSSGDSRILKIASRLFCMRNTQFKRKINCYGWLSLPLVDLPGPAEWLSGGSMAFKKSVFKKVKFDERLETFGNYALGEDVDFSHRVFLEFGEPHLITNAGYVIHHPPSKGKKPIKEETIAAYFFNPALIRSNFAAYGKKFCSISVFWGEIGIILLLLKSGVSFFDIIKWRKITSKKPAQ